jgi:hypothetical protein
MRAHRPQNTDLVVFTDQGEPSRRVFDTAELMEQPTWHARGAIPAPQIRPGLPYPNRVAVAARGSQEKRHF